MTVAKRSLALLLAVTREVDRRNETNPLRPPNGGTPIRWPIVGSVLDHLQPDRGWNANVARKEHKKAAEMLSREDIESRIVGVDPETYREAVRHMMETGTRPGGRPPVVPGVTPVPKPEPKEEPTEPDVAGDVTLRKVQRERDFYKSGYKQMVDDRAQWEELLEAVADAVATVDPIRPADLPAPVILLNNRHRRLMPLFSDLHGGQKVEAGNLKGFNEYNFDVLDQRLDNWCGQIEEHFQHERTAGPVEFIDLPMIGDIIDGENVYRGQWRHIETTAMRQIFLTADRISGAVMRLARLGVPLRIRGVGGNHGRMGRKGESDFSNDFILYKYLQAKLEGQPNISFEFDWAFWMTAKHWDWRFYFCHGDNMRGWGGFPWYGQARADTNTLQMMLTQGAWYHFFIHGHFHTDMSLQTPIGKRFANGNWVGVNEYSVNGGFGGRPSQKLLVVTEKGGVEKELTLYLDEITPDFMNRAAGSAGLGWGIDPRP